jgi:peptidoglycan/LPS O-acetylase OafA/YrhL
LKNAGRWLTVASLSAAVCGASVLSYQHFAYHDAMKWTFGYSLYLLPAWGFVWGYSIINAVSATALIYALQDSSPLKRILEFGLLAHIGEISYGIYVFHVPILLAFEHLPIPRVEMIVLYCAAIYTVSKISFRYLETPFLRLKARNSAQQSPAKRNAVATRGYQ